MTDRATRRQRIIDRPPDMPQIGGDDLMYWEYWMHRFGEDRDDGVRWQLRGFVLNTAQPPRRALETRYIEAEAMP